jgi:parallel beta-helix repeat protein
MKIDKNLSIYNIPFLSRSLTTSVLIGYSMLALLTSSCTSSTVIPKINPTSVPVPCASNCTYYANGELGSDFNDGSQAHPWRTIQKAANTAIAGDTVRVMAGNYVERVQVSRTGIIFEGNNATMQGFTISADNVTVKGFYITDTPNTEEDGYGVNVSGSNCVIENNYIYYATRGGVLLSASSSNCEVKNNKFERNSQLGIAVEGTHHIVEGNEIWGSIQYHPKWTDSPRWVDADGIRFFGSGHVFRNNYIHDIHYGIPENMNPHIDCFQTWTDIYQEATNNILFEDNRCINQDAQTLHEIGQGFMIGGGEANAGGANKIVIRNNLILAYRGINAAYAGNLTIINNTFVGQIPQINELGEYGVFFTDAISTNLVQNNIFYNIIGSSCNIHGIPSDGNLFYITPGSGYLRCSPVAGDLWQIDPLFVNPDAGDYHLQDGSPAINTGIGGVTFGVYGSPTP